MEDMIRQSHGSTKQFVSALTISFLNESQWNWPEMLLLVSLPDIVVGGLRFYRNSFFYLLSFRPLP